MTTTTYAVGTEVLNQCTFGSGFSAVNDDVQIDHVQQVW